MKKTVTVFAATGVAGSACVNELIAQDVFNVQVLARKQSEQEKSSFRPKKELGEKEKQFDVWQQQGVTILSADTNDTSDLIPVLKGTDYLVSCVPFTATESQYPLIWAAKEAGVERFVPSEFGYIYEWEQFWPTDTVHRAIARQKAFIRRVIELAGMDYTIIPAGFWPEFYMAEPVIIPGDPDQRVAWSAGVDVGRIIPHVLAHPLSRNAVCPVAATAYCSWNELLDTRERLLGRSVERLYMDEAQLKKAYQTQSPGPAQAVLAISLAAAECPEGMPLWAHWNAKHLPEFSGTPLDELFPNVIEPTVLSLVKEMQNSQQERG